MPNKLHLLSSKEKENAKQRFQQDETCKLIVIVWNSSHLSWYSFPSFSDQPSDVKSTLQCTQTKVKAIEKVSAQSILDWFGNVPTLWSHLQNFCKIKNHLLRLHCFLYMAKRRKTKFTRMPLIVKNCTRSRNTLKMNHTQHAATCMFTMLRFIHNWRSSESLRNTLKMKIIFFFDTTRNLLKRNICCKTEEGEVFSKHLKKEPKRNDGKKAWTK